MNMDLVGWTVFDWVFDLKTVPTKDQALAFPAFAAADGIFVQEQSCPNFQIEPDRNHSRNAWTYPDRQLKVVEQGAVVAGVD